MVPSSRGGFYNQNKPSFELQKKVLQSKHTEFLERLLIAGVGSYNQNNPSCSKGFQFVGKVPALSLKFSDA